MEASRKSQRARRSRSAPRDGDGAAPPLGPSVDEALARAARHGRRALGEALAALRALLDAAVLASTGVPVNERRGLRQLALVLDSAVEALAGDGGPEAARLLDALAEALDEEIRRWEERARDDPEARAVLRAFLGLREVLWEFGVRPRSTPSPPPASESGRGARRPHVERVPVEGDE